jgi:NAD(P)-dependent dehydrogenase (short-subunit alcohol dehydrogenase family)
MKKRVKDKICLVTGATAGIGKVTARELARMGATVVIVARDRGRGESTVDQIRCETGNANVHLMLCDLSSQAAIRHLAVEYLARFDSLHVLVNNAGAIFRERRVTADGLEATFATNHIAYFLLTTLLLDAIKASAPARIVSVASELHRNHALDFDDLQFERRAYGAMHVYGQSKLANVIWSGELARRLEGTGVTANSLHPGTTASNIASSGPDWMRIGIKLLWPFLLTPDKGAETSLYLATSPEVERVSGKYFDKKKPCEASDAARDPATGRRLWTVSEDLTAKSSAAVA